MGTFATLYHKQGNRIPEEKKTEFLKRVELLFQAGGMMEFRSVRLIDKKAVTIQMATMDDCGMDFYYNYFEEAYWENAGVNKKHCYVRSEKIGWQHFCETVIAAYVLEELYTEGPTITVVNGDPVIEKQYTGWINYLFQEHYAVKSRDPWKAFEVRGERKIHYPEDIEWAGFVHDPCGIRGYYEVKAVIKGTDAVIDEFNYILTEKQKQTNKETKNFFYVMEKLKGKVEKYRSQNELKEEEQLSRLLELFQILYEKNLKKIDRERHGDIQLFDICWTIIDEDVPAFGIKVLSEVYEKDFWELWDEVKNVVCRRRDADAGDKMCEANPVTTADFLEIEQDDLIYFWEDDGKIQFSDELRKWFENLKDEFDQLMEQGVSVEKVLFWILELMEYACENYFRIFTFTGFFEETLEHLQDSRYIALWKIYDKMLHDPEMERAGSVIFVSNEESGRNEGVDYYDETPRRLISTWNFIGADKRNNKARVTLRRYMALVANQKLRKIVFGF